VSVEHFQIVPTWRHLDDAARETGVSRRTLNRWIAQGRLRVYRVPGDRYRMVDMDEIKQLRKPEPIDRPPSESET
jgi:excisionase family DNA binding protein